MEPSEVIGAGKRVEFAAWRPEMGYALELLGLQLPGTTDVAYLPTKVHNQTSGPVITSC